MDGLNDALMPVLAAVQAGVLNRNAANASVDLPLAEYYADKGKWPPAADSVMGNATGKYTASISITSGANMTSLSMQLTGTMKSANVSKGVAGSTMILQTSDGGKNWLCSAGNIAAKYRPASCR